MTQVIDARFREGGKEYSFNPGELTVEPGQGVIVSTPKGPEYAVCTKGNHLVDETTLLSPLRPVLRLAGEEDKPPEEPDRPRERPEGKPAAFRPAPPRPLTEAERRRQKEAMAVCREKIAQQGLEMSLVRAEPSPDGGKIVFYFTAENRVDFRALVKDLASTLHCRIELRQIGVRDETKMLGGIGICGQPYCCCRFLDKFQPVSIKMAKTQNLSLNPTKISGACGRLMCCLKYEQGAYEDAVKRCPKKESFVETPDGAGNVTDVNLLREKVKVRIEGGDEQPKTYYNQEVRVIRSGKGKRPEDYVLPPKEELEKLRYIPPESQRRQTDPSHGSLAEKLEELLATEAQRGAEHAARTRSHSRRAGGQGGKGGQAKAKAQPAKPQGGQNHAGNSAHHRRRRPHPPKET